jgi:hypothetical protein
VENFIIRHSLFDIRNSIHHRLNSDRVWNPVRVNRSDFTLPTRSGYDFILFMSACASPHADRRVTGWHGQSRDDPPGRLYFVRVKLNPHIL